MPVLFSMLYIVITGSREGGVVVFILQVRRVRHRHSDISLHRLSNQDANLWGSCSASGPPLVPPLARHTPGVQITSQAWMGCMQYPGCVYCKDEDIKMRRSHGVCPGCPASEWEQEDSAPPPSAVKPKFLPLSPAPH